VSTARPLRLRTEEVSRQDKTVAELLPVARLWVDNSLSHLDGSYDYLVPKSLDAQVKIGVRVGVNFAGREVEALVIDRNDDTSHAGLKTISSVLSPVVVAPPQLISLISSASQRWLAHPYDLIRSAIPPRVASVDRGAPTDHKAHALQKKKSNEISYIHIQPHENALVKTVDFAKSKLTLGSVLLIVPEERELSRLIQIYGDQAVVLSGSLSRSDRYRNYLSAISGSKHLIIGTRSAIFAAPNDLQTIILFREISESLYEPRTPGWNVRELAFIRSKSEDLDLYFAGYSPSSEIAEKIEQGEVRFIGKRNRLKVTNHPSTNGELLPGRIFVSIRAALKVGPVLFLVPRKGYASSLMCKKCRNIALCECGGKLSKSAANKPATCVHCGINSNRDKCQWCGSDATILLGRGAERHAEEIGRAFPGYPVFYSNAQKPVEEVDSAPALVISTTGMVPQTLKGYAAVVLLEGDSFFSFADLRAQERARESFFEAASHVSLTGEILTIIDSTHPITSALTRWNPATMAARELAERKEVSLPPYTRAVLLETETKDATGIVSGIRKAVFDKRLPSSVIALGPSQSSGDLSRILLTCQISQSEEFLKFLHEFIRHRAIAKKSKIFLRVDPYSLSS
jgi:primosomal protein N' (replication factor Y) (superfamily II helicase)